MRQLLLIAVATVAMHTQAFGQAVDPDVRGPVRRGAGATAEALGAPGVENRIEARQDRRAGDWRMRRYNDEWWYYTPQARWMYYRGNRWMPYEQATFRPLTPRYTTGYRGAYTGRIEAPDRFAYGNAGAPMLTVAIRDGSFEPSELSIAPGMTVTWTNQGSEIHTVTAADGSWDSGEIAPGNTYSARFKRAGNYPYICDLHQEMKGTIQVGEAAAQNPQTADAEVTVGREERADPNARPGVDVNVDEQPSALDRRPAAEVPAPQPAPQPTPAAPRPQ